MKPGLGYQSSRQRTLERHVAASDRVPPNQGREANPRYHRNGRHRGITVDAITQGAAGTVKLVYHNGTGFTSAVTSAPANITVEAYCYMLNTADTIAADTAVILMHMDDGTWEIIAAHCEVRDWDLEEE